MRYLTIIATVIALVIVVGNNAEACDTSPAQNMASQQVYVYGSPRPHFRTPLRTALWALRQPVAYTQPVYRVQPSSPVRTADAFTKAS